MTILYPKTSQEFYHHTKFWKYNEHEVTNKKKTVIKKLVMFPEKHIVGVSFLRKIQAFSSISRVMMVKKKMEQEL